MGTDIHISRPFVMGYPVAIITSPPGIATSMRIVVQHVALSRFGPAHFSFYSALHMRMALWTSSGLPRGLLRACRCVGYATLDPPLLMGSGIRC